MTITRATVRLNAVSGEPADAVNNVWHFEHTGPTELVADAITNPLETFYVDISSVFSSRVDRSIDAHTITLATLSPGGAGPDDDVVSSVEVTHMFPGIVFPAQGAGVALPAEVAMCLSFEGDTSGLQEESGLTRPKARRRGRVFLGPWNINIMSSTSSGLFEAATIATMRAFYAPKFIATLTDENDITGLRHVIYSPTTGETHNITKCWIDDAPDIIRSRGIKASTRNSSPVTQPS